MLTKTVLNATADGGCELIEVPFSWRHGDQLPMGARVLNFASATEALAELNRRGREANRVHLPKPEKPPRKPVEPASPPR